MSRRLSSDALLARIRALATEWPGVGYRVIHFRLREEGERVNHKRVLRLWRQIERPKRRMRRARMAASVVAALAQPQRNNERWALDFLSDRLADGRTYRILAVIDVYTRLCLALTAARSMPAVAVVRCLHQLVKTHGAPSMVTVDNGPELVSKAMSEWATQNNVVLRFSRPGTPTDNPFIESFNARVRAECTDIWWTDTIAEADAALHAWRHRYNTQRPHGALGGLPPARFAHDQQMQQNITL